MKKSHILRYLVGSGVLLTALLAVGASVIGAGTPVSANSARKFDISKIVGVRPLRSQARKISTTGGTASIAAGQIPPCLDSGVQPRCYSPKQLQKAYGIDGLLKSGVTGKGRTIVVIDASSGPNLQSDLHYYDQLYGLKDPKLNVIAPFGLPPFDPNVYVETALDVEMSHAVAPDATIDLVVTGDTTNDITPESFFVDLLKPVKYAVDHNLGDTISISYGIGESCVSAAYLKAQHEVFAAARAKNISIFVSAGDTGAANYSCTKDGKIFLDKAASIPASDTLATSIGGTTLNADKAGNYIGESVWNEDAIGRGATGGGFSNVVKRPAYQDSVTNNPYRGLPDVSWVGDPFTGVVIVFSENGATYITPVGGTSVGAPAWAGIAALANQSAGKRLGFLNNAIYRILQSSSYSQAFNDILLGNNTVQGFDVKGKTIFVPGYSANTGWDPVTGAGTPKVGALVKLLPKFVKADDGKGL